MDRGLARGGGEGQIGIGQGAHRVPQRGVQRFPEGDDVVRVHHLVAPAPRRGVPHDARPRPDRRRGVPEHPETGEDLGAVVLVVLDQVPDDPPKRVLLSPGGLPFLAQVGGIEVLEEAFQRCMRDLEPLENRRHGREPPPPGFLPLRVGEALPSRRAPVCVGLSMDPAVPPVLLCRDGVTQHVSNRPEGWGGTEVQVTVPQGGRSLRQEGSIIAPIREEIDGFHGTVLGGILAQDRAFPACG